jgi:hypothetical protein
LIQVKVDIEVPYYTFYETYKLTKDTGMMRYPSNSYTYMLKSAAGKGCFDVPSKQIHCITGFIGCNQWLPKSIYR